MKTGRRVPRERRPKPQAAGLIAVSPRPRSDGIVPPPAWDRITRSGERSAETLGGYGPFVDQQVARLRKELETYELILGRLRSEGDVALQDLARNIEQRIAETKARMDAATLAAPARRA